MRSSNADAANGQWDASGCFRPNYCEIYNNSWGHIGFANGLCQYRDTIFSFPQADRDANFPIGTAGEDAGPVPNATFDHNELVLHYYDGGCWCSNTIAMDFNCGGFDYSITETEAGCPAHPQGEDIIVRFPVCHVTQDGGWTPPAQGTCRREWQLIPYWNAPPICPH
jgi:hypothetical protein